MVVELPKANRKFGMPRIARLIPVLHPLAKHGLKNLQPTMRRVVGCNVRICSIYATVLFFLQAIDPSWSSSDGGSNTETLVGIVGNDFVMLGADSSISQSISLTVSNYDKIAVIVNPQQQSQQQLHSFDDNHENSDSRSSSDDIVVTHHRHQYQQAILAAAAGDAADIDRLMGLLQAHASIREYEAGIGCDVTHIDMEEKEEEWMSTTANNNNKDGDVNSRLDERRSSRTFVSSEPGLDVEAIAYLARGQIAHALRSRHPLHVRLLIAGMTYDDNNDDDVVNMPLDLLLLPNGMAESPQRRQVQTQQAAEKQHALTADDDDAAASAGPMEMKKVEDMIATDDDGNDCRDVPLLRPRLYWIDSYGALQELQQYGAHGYGSHFLLSILDDGYRPNLSREQAIKLLQECFAQLRQRYVINSPYPPCIKCVDAHGCHLMSGPLKTTVPESICDER